MDYGARIQRHPVLPPIQGRWVKFAFNGTEMIGREGEMVSSSVFASGERVFGHHHKDGSPQGLFCANGQCSQCTLLIDGIPLKSCIVPLKGGMRVESLEGLPELPPLKGFVPGLVKHVDTDVLIIGGGPSGMAAARELGQAGHRVIIADDKNVMGGKLVLQTHKFFGSVADCSAGTRGITIASNLEEELRALPSVFIWLESIVLAVFSDGTVGIRTPEGYAMVRPRQLLVAAGAREKSLPFPGCTLPGVFGAGAFQTLVNRDLIDCSRRIFVLGGGNVGLIGAYHALQAGMTVAGLAEGMEKCGGYKVHADKILRLGVPIYTRHTVLAAEGEERLDSVTITGVDASFRPIAGTGKCFRVDTLLVAVGLSPVNEFHTKALEFGIPSMLTGDAEEIAEASAAMFSGMICGRRISCRLSGCEETVPEEWSSKAEILKSPGGAVSPYRTPKNAEGVYPVIHCFQEIPCNPCMTVCPKELIGTGGHPVMGLPEFCGDCIGCRKCVAVCPGLAVTLVDFRKNPEKPVVTLPWELGQWVLEEGCEVTVADWEGEPLGSGTVQTLKAAPGYPATMLLDVQVDRAIANRVAGIRIQDPGQCLPELEVPPAPVPDDAVVCRCERVTAGEIRVLLRQGVRDMNELKARTRAGFGSCGGKTCKTLISSIIRAEGMDPSEVTDFTERPLFAETQLGFFANREEL